MFRFIAALLVVFFHFGYKMHLFNGNFISRLVLNGHMAVCFFFVLSGFVMVISNKNNQFENASLKKFFWKKRAVRLLPAYYLAFAVTVVIWLVSHVEPNLYEIVYYCLGSNGWMTEYMSDINPPAWSLTAEFLFYILTPFLIIWSLKNYKSFSIFSWVLWLASSIVFYWLWTMKQDDIVPYSPIPILHVGTFLMGMIAGKIWLKKEGVLIANKNTNLILLILNTVILLLLLQDQFFHENQTPLPAPLFATLILLTVQLEYHSPIKRQSFFNFLGNLSYPIYILHWPLFKLYEYLYPQDTQIMWFLIYVALLIAFSAATYYLLEKPIKDFFVEKKKPHLQS